MDETEFLRLAESTLKQLETTLLDLDAEEFDVDLAGGVLTIEFEDETKYIVNRQRAAKQIWLAAAARAWHFGYTEETGRWIATSDGDELGACLARLLKDKAGVDVKFA